MDLNINKHYNKMESNLCLYNAMKKNGLLPTMTPSEARKYYGSKVENFIKEAYNMENIPTDELLTSPNSMGSISILQLYLKENPQYAFKIYYDNGAKHFWMKGNNPKIVKEFIHYGNYNSGHFEAHNVVNSVTDTIGIAYHKNTFAVCSYNKLGY